MTKEEALSFLKIASNHNWDFTVKDWRDNATKLQEHDMILATIMRRLALNMEKYVERVKAHLLLNDLDQLDKIMEEDHIMIEQMFARVASKPTGQA
jgi:hypothetical protein